MPTPQSTVAGTASGGTGSHYLDNHIHPAGTMPRQEPLYDPYNVYANGQLIALYNAATTPGSFKAPTVPRVTVTQAVQNVEGDDDNTAGKVQADRFLAEKRITQKEYDEITTTPRPKTQGVPPGPPVPGKSVDAVSIAGLTYNTVLTPGGTTLGQMIKNVTFPRTIEQLTEGYPGMTPTQIVNNLAALAANIVEPVKRQYPKAFLTNSFRHGATVGGGQHGTGQACDIQIRGLPAHSYYEVALWMSKNLPYDQLLLEYLPNKTVWIHVSYAIPNIPYGGLWISKNKPQNKLATLNGAAGGKFTVNLHEDIIVAAVPNRVVAA